MECTKRVKTRLADRSHCNTFRVNASKFMLTADSLQDWSNGEQIRSYAIELSASRSFLYWIFPSPKCSQDVQQYER